MSFKRFCWSWVMVVALIPFGPVQVHTPSVKAAGATAIAYGDTVEGQLGGKTYYVVYQFEGQQGDHVVITMTGDGNLDPYLGLLDGTSQEVLVEDDDGAGNSNALIETDLPQTDTYLIIATRYGLDTGTSEGSYTLDLQGGTGPVGATTNISNANQTTTNATEPEMIEEGVYYMGMIALGDVISGEISRDMVAGIYEVPLDAGTTVTITMAADNSNLDSFLIFTSSNEELAHDDDSGADLPGGGPNDATITVTVPDNDSYFIVAMRQGGPNGTTIGAFTLSVTDQSQGQQTSGGQDYSNSVSYAGDIAIGDTVSGTIRDEKYLWFYVLQGNANEQITITAVGEGGLDTYLGVMNSAEDMLAEDDDSGGGANGTDAQISLRLPETDTYLIIITRAGIEQGPTSGDYSLTISSGTPQAPAGNSGFGGFGGLPGRAVESDTGTLYLRGFGWTDDPVKATPLLQAAAAQAGLPGR